MGCFYSNKQSLGMHFHHLTKLKDETTVETMTFDATRLDI